ncbi:MAG: KH domain-containing protein [Firmicutes bacterium]|nr:KH domain-containing protein [Bacillota bacterium]
MEELIKYIMGHLADEPEKIVIEKTDDTILVKVPKSDMGKVIGRQGRIAKAIRTIVKSASGGGKPVSIDIVEA